MHRRRACNGSLAVARQLRVTPVVRQIPQFMHSVGNAEKMLTLTRRSHLSKSKLIVTCCTDKQGVPRNWRLPPYVTLTNCDPFYPV